jgi:hypothetical protein
MGQINQDSQSSIGSNFDLMIGINLLYANYTFGVEEGANEGQTNGYSLSINLLNKTHRKVTIQLGSLFIDQQSSRFCEGAGEINKDFKESIYYVSADLEIFSTSYVKTNIGISFNNSDEESTVCSNEIYFTSPLLNYNIGLGLIEEIYLNFGFNTDYEINKSFGNNFGLYSSGVNYIINTRDFLILNYYWNRDNYYNYFYSGWLLKSHFNLYKNYGIDTNVYYSRDIKGISFNFGFTYIL